MPSVPGELLGWSEVLDPVREGQAEDEEVTRADLSLVLIRGLEE